jgi:hypothetical protein
MNIEYIHARYSSIMSSTFIHFIRKTLVIIHTYSNNIRKKERKKYDQDSIDYLYILFSKKTYKNMTNRPLNILFLK